MGIGKLDLILPGATRGDNFDMWTITPPPQTPRLVARVPRTEYWQPSGEPVATDAAATGSVDEPLMNPYDDAHGKCAGEMRLRRPMEGTMPRRIREVLARRSAEGLVGRDEEIAALMECLEDDGPIVTQVHGVAGVGKSGLLRAFCDRARESGATVLALDARLIEPTTKGFLLELGHEIDAEVSDVEEAARRLDAFPGRVVLALDTYEVFRLMDTWLRQEFIPSLTERVRVVLVGRQPPVPVWVSAPEWRGLFRSLALNRLPDEDALQLLADAGLEDSAASRINRFARGHPLALHLAASAAAERPDLALEEAALPHVVQELSRLFLADVADPATREALEAGSVVRRITHSLLGAMCQETACEEAIDRLLTLPLVERRRDGLRMHDAVHEAIAETLRSRDPSRYRKCRQAAWHQLRREVRTASHADLWRYTADLLYLIENPVVREAFFPSGAQQLAVEPARPAHAPFIRPIAERHDPRAAVELIAGWWDRLPEAFSVVRDAEGTTVGYYCMFEPSDDSAGIDGEDPVVSAWHRHLAEDGVAEGEKVLFLRRWIGIEQGEAPSPVQAACWLDVKRAYMDMRPDLRRVYLTVVDLETYAPVAVELGFRPLPDAAVEIDGVCYHTAVLDFGPASVDGWLAGLAATELGIEQAGILDLESRELVLDERREPLTKLEFGVMAYLCEHESKVVSRDDLLRRVWGNNYMGGSNVVDAVVYTLRKKLDERSGLIETVRGAGYRLLSN